MGAREASKQDDIKILRTGAQLPIPDKSQMTLWFPTASLQLP
jgi:hypothetical protein